jgi:hypothetical protein
MIRRAATLAVVLAAVAFLVTAAVTSTAGAAARRSQPMLLGLMDDALISGPTDTAFASIQQLHPQVIRWDVYWPAIARKRPARPMDSTDPAYNFTKMDDIAERADKLGIPLLFTISGTPAWAGGGANGLKVPTRGADLQNFAFAVASRYDGTHTDANGNPLPAVTRWEAWNEPNTASHLIPQWTTAKHGIRCLGKTWSTTPVSPRLYIGILNAIYRGVHAAGNAAGITEQVAGGATKPTGSGPCSSEPSVSPLRFVRELAKRHAIFDVYAHHPYRTCRSIKPCPLGSPDNVGFENMSSLFKALDRGWPGKHLHVWITEYGVQTNPPDRYLGVSWAQQATFLRRNVGIARANPRIDLFVWFLINDEIIHGPFAAGFQTGLATVTGAKKPAWAAFQSLAR